MVIRFMERGFKKLRSFFFAREINVSETVSGIFVEFYGSRVFQFLEQHASNVVLLKCLGIIEHATNGIVVACQVRRRFERYTI